MGKKKQYKIRKSDLRYAIDYLERRLDQGHYGFESDVQYDNAYKDFRNGLDLEGLNKWINNYLDDQKWRRLQAAIRQRRSKKARQPELRTVTLSFTAWLYMKELAKSDQVTLSEVIEKYLEKPWKKLHGYKY